MTIEERPLPADSLLAQHRDESCYRDAFCAVVPGDIALPAYIRAFYSSMVFTPERKVLGLIGRGATRADIDALAEGRTTQFAAWSVEARQDHQILLRDFQDQTCSWLMVEAAGAGATTIWFGSGVRRPDKPLVSALMPFHRWYSRRLLAGARRNL